VAQPLRPARRSGQRLDRGILVAVFVVAALLHAPRAVLGGCAPARNQIIWSYPADGATGVPTDARLLILTPGGLVTGAIQVNGQPIERDPTDVRLGFEAKLAPSTPYVVEVPGYPDSATFRFATATGPAAAPPPSSPVVERVATLSQRSLAPVCRNALSIGQCFDTPPYVDRVFQTRSRPLLFIVLWQPPAEWPPSVPQSSQPVLPIPVYWPGECGDPEIFDKVSICFGTYRISAVGSDGQVVAADYPCDRPTAPVAGGATVSGCSIGKSDLPAPFTVIALIAMAALTRRRGERPSRDG
jgi:hypothetical protein